MIASSTSRKPVSRSFKLRISLRDSDSLSFSGIFDLQSDLCHRKFVYGECATSQSESLHRLNCLTGLCALYSRLTRKPSPADNEVTGDFEPGKILQVKVRII